MTPYAPVLGAPRRLGQLSQAFGLTDSIAQSIVKAAEPATRRVIREERTKFAEALMEGVAASSAALLTFIGTRYFVPDHKKTLKGVGYGLSAIFVGAGAVWALSSLREPEAPAPAGAAPGTSPQIVKTASEQAAQDLVANAEPKIRAIVDEERARLVSAALSALPFAAVGGLAAIGTAVLIKDDKKWAKAAGYAAATGLVSVGLWIGLSKEAE